MLFATELHKCTSDKIFENLPNLESITLPSGEFIKRSSYEKKTFTNAYSSHLIRLGRKVKNLQLFQLIYWLNHQLFCVYL